jgi:hypothetical protein
MLDARLEQVADEIAGPEEPQQVQHHRRKRFHRAQRQKRLERFRKKALVAFLFVLTIGMTLAIWYELLKT